MMHKHGEQQNDWKWNSDQPKQHAFSKRHSSLHFMLGEQRARVPLVPCTLSHTAWQPQAAANPLTARVGPGRALCRPACEDSAGAKADFIARQNRRRRQVVRSIVCDCAVKTRKRTCPKVN
jgi:hypothetical protein